MKQTPEEIAAKNNTKSFSAFINGLEYGVLSDDLARHLQEVVAELNDHRAMHGGKPSAEITIKLKFTLEDKTIEVKPSVDVKLPEEKRTKTVFFVTPDNNLSRSDMNQPDMFRALPKAIQVDPQTGEIKTA